MNGTNTNRSSDPVYIQTATLTARLATSPARAVTARDPTIIAR